MEDFLFLIVGSHIGTHLVIEGKENDLLKAFLSACKNKNELNSLFLNIALELIKEMENKEKKEILNIFFKPLKNKKK